MTEELLATIREKDSTIQKATLIIEDLKYDFELVLQQLRQCEQERESLSVQIRDTQRRSSMHDKENINIKHGSETPNQHIKHQYRVKEQGFQAALSKLQQCEGQIQDMTATISTLEGEKIAMQIQHTHDLDFLKRQSQHVSKAPITHQIVLSDPKSQFLGQQLEAQIHREDDLIEFLQVVQVNQRIYMKFMQENQQPIQSPEQEALKMKCNDLETRLADTQIREYNLGMLLSDLGYSYQSLKYLLQQLMQVVSAHIQSRNNIIIHHDHDQHDIGDGLSEVVDIMDTLEQFMTSHSNSKQQMLALQRDNQELRSVITARDDEIHRLHSQGDDLGNQLRALQQTLEVEKADRERQREQDANQTMHWEDNNQSIFLLEQTLEDLEHVQADKESLFHQYGELRIQHQDLQGEHQHTMLKLGKFKQLLANIYELDDDAHQNDGFFGSFMGFYEYVSVQIGDKSLNEVIEHYRQQRGHSEQLNKIAVRLLEMQDQKDAEVVQRIEHIIQSQKQQYQVYRANESPSHNVKAYRDHQTMFCQTVINIFKIWKEQMIAIAQLFYELSMPHQQPHLQDQVDRCFQVIQKSIINM